MNNPSKMERVEALLRSASPHFAIFNDATVDDSEKLDSLKDELANLSDQAKNIQATADAEKRALTEDEKTEINSIFARFEAVEEDIETRERISNARARVAAPSGRRTDPDDIVDVTDVDTAPGAVRATARTTRRTVPAQARDASSVGKWGFRSFGEYAQSVKAAVRSSPGQVDPRLIANAPTTATREDVGADGGFAVPPDFRTAIMVKVTGEDSLVSRTDQLTSSSNSITLPKDETTPWQTSGGIQAAWESELGQLNQSKVALETDTIRLNKLTALVPVSEEALEDASQLTSYINRKAPEKFAFKINDAIINGTGAGQPKGILSAASLVTQTKESGQASDTVVFQNIVNMWSRLYGPLRQNAAWLINQDIEPQLLGMQFPGTGTAVPVYLPPGGLSASPYGMLMGRPVIPTQACQTLGDKGDIILTDLRQYMTAMKTGGIRQDVSMHLWFDYDTSAFRFIMRIAGQPWWTSAITPKNGSNSLSWAVTLEAR